MGDAGYSTPTAIRARLIEAFEVDESLPDEAPRLAAGFAPAHLPGRPADPVAYLGDGDARASEHRMISKSFGRGRRRNKDEFYNDFGGGYEMQRGVERAEAARKSAEAKAIAEIFREARRKVRSDTAYWADLCQKGAALAARLHRRRHEQIRWIEALGWVALPYDKARKIALDEPVIGVWKARKETLAWLRSGKSEAAYCAAYDIERADLRRWTSVYCRALASRVAPQRPAKLARGAYGGRLDHLAFGAEEIARELGRTVKNVVRMIDAGKLPVADFLGEPCAHRVMLAPYRPHATRRVAAAMPVFVSEADIAIAERANAFHQFADGAIDTRELYRRIAPPDLAKAPSMRSFLTRDRAAFASGQISAAEFKRRQPAAKLPKLRLIEGGKSDSSTPTNPLMRAVSCAA